MTATSLPLLLQRWPATTSPITTLKHFQRLSWKHSNSRVLLIAPTSIWTIAAQRRRAPARCCSSAAKDGDGEAPSWTAWIPRSFSLERVLKLISGATSSPIGQFIESPRTFLHSIDPRVKMVWLIALVVLPARSHIYMRIGLVLYLSFLSVLVLPARVWMDQLGRVAFLAGILFIMLGFGSDSVPPAVQLRTPPPSMIGLPDIPKSLAGYSYMIMKLGPFQLTRKGLSVASTSACLTFTIFQSASLCLTTTTPEQLASALWWFMYPLSFVGVSVDEVILTLLLSLRFINLVFDEVRNTALGIVARRICWQKLTFLETLDVFVMYVRRIFKNIFNHAEQISKAMIARGFRGDSSTHKIYLLSNSTFGLLDFVSLLCLLGLFGAAVLSERALI
ncbi:protein ABCI12, chloroplastic [Dendrobium catenatum]|uniref:Protein ABCI12, chloroplastic n=1 Tax=Dendrobium catenatum TaxID=906689 RepID=A0A2I0WY32_9ASPA|nr:protein ABCI12, chloroplastic [Dendrobium catenatum]XP_028550428.1 protein ABCI12, chloroplastic [Dendrobium catenatum]PKU80565.1 Protein ABCI12, chloroplastic [Dendrobium catenatum]